MEASDVFVEPFTHEAFKLSVEEHLELADELVYLQNLSIDIIDQILFLFLSHGKLSLVEIDLRSLQEVFDHLLSFSYFLEIKFVLDLI